MPELLPPASPMTESNKGVNCVVMLRGPVKREVRLPYYRKLMRIVTIRVNLSHVNFVER